MALLSSIWEDDACSSLESETELFHLWCVKDSQYGKFVDPYRSEIITLEKPIKVDFVEEETW